MGKMSLEYLQAAHVQPFKVRRSELIYSIIVLCNNNLQNRAHVEQHDK